MESFEKPQENDWVQPIEKDYLMQCCDCGLVHEVDFRVFDGRAQFRVRRNNALTVAARKRKPNHVGAPRIFLLEAACQQINDAFGGFGCYLVGSATERADWRDVDVRFIMADDEFFKLFPQAGDNAHWEFDPRWILINTSIAEQLQRVTGLPIDFQIQPQTFANKHHPGTRHALGLRMAPPERS